MIFGVADSPGGSQHKEAASLLDLPADSQPGDTPPFLLGVPKLTEEGAARSQLPLAADMADTQREASVADTLLTDMADSSPLAEQAEAEDLLR